jgi:hypothetical protein
MANPYVSSVPNTMLQWPLTHLASPLTGTAMTKWNGSETSLAAIQESEPDYLRTYYIGTDSEIHEFYGNPQGPGAIAGIG